MPDGGPPRSILAVARDLATKEQLGHSSINVTMDLYGHVRPGAHRAVVDRLAAATMLTPEARPNSRKLRLS